MSEKQKIGETVAMKKDLYLWRASFLVWGVMTLSFMAGMSIGSGIFALATVWYFYKHREALRPMNIRAYLIACAAFFGAALLSVAAAVISPPMGLPLEGFGSLQKFHFFLLPLFACAVLSATGNLERHPLWRALFWMATFASLVGIVQFWGTNLFPAAWLDDRFFRVIATGAPVNRFHAQGLMYFHLSFASALCFTCSWAAARLLWPLQKETSRDRAAWAAFTVITFLALFFTYSRIAWVAMMAILVVLAFLKKPKWGLLCSLALFCATALIWNFSDSMRGRWKLGMESLFERQEVWSGALAMVRDRPLTGVGFGKTGYYSRPYEIAVLGHDPQFSSHAHNNFLDMLAAMGFTGLIAFLAWWFVLGMFALRSFRESAEHERWLPAGCIAGLVAFHINGLTQVNYFDAKSEHALMLWAGVVLALEWRRMQRRKGLGA
jgi:O-antigen ligase